MAFIAKFLASKFVSVRSGYAMKRGGAAIASGDYKAAIDAFDEAVEAKKEIIGSTQNTTVAQAMASLANAHRFAGNTREAATILTDVVEIYQSELPSTDPELFSTMNNLAVVLRVNKQHDEARAVFSEALRLTILAEEEGAAPGSLLSGGHDAAAISVNAARNELESAAGSPTTTAAAQKAVQAAERLLRGAVESRRAALPVHNPEADGMMPPSADETLALALEWLGEALVAKHAALLPTARALEPACSDGGDSGDSLDPSDVLAEAVACLTEAAEMHRTLLGEALRTPGIGGDADTVGESLSEGEAEEEERDDDRLFARSAQVTELLEAASTQFSK